MSSLVTTPSNRSVQDFIEAIQHAQKIKDAYALLHLFEKHTGHKAIVWGNDKIPDFLIGFGQYTYKRKGSKDEFTWFQCGFAPRKAKLTLYMKLDLETEQDLLSRLGKCKWGRGCLYVNKLADLNEEVLIDLIAKNQALFNLDIEQKDVIA